MPYTFLVGGARSGKSTLALRRASAFDSPGVVVAPVVVGNDGNFSFKSLAPGKYKVQAWNEQSGEPLMSTVTIKEGTNEDNIELKGGGQAISPDKFGTPRQ